MGIRPQWIGSRTVGFAVAALMLISFLGPHHHRCAGGPHGEHGTHAVIATGPADEHGCHADHQRQPDLRADRTQATRGADGAEFGAAREVVTQAPIVPRRTRLASLERTRWRPGRTMLIDLCLARS
jgi:hypothetical protein